MEKNIKIIQLILRSIFNNVMHIISYLTPKNKDLWIFGAWLGQNYSDNCKYLFEYVNENHPEKRAVWLTKNKEIIKIIKGKGFESYYINSLKGHYLSLTAGVFIVSHTKLGDLNGYVGPRAKIVQLWHGIPMKKFLFDNRRQNEYLFTSKWKLIEFFLPFLVSNYSLIISTSDEVKHKFASAFNTPLEKIKITGYPRNDILYNKSDLKIKNHEKKFYNGIYLPTLRGKGGSIFNLFSTFGFELELLENFLLDNKIKLYIKLHPLNKLPIDIKEKIVKSECLHIFDEDLYENLNQFDFLITDYSSIYFDYLLLDRPIIFAPFDYEKYISDDRELYYDYYDFTPGPKANNWNELIIYMEDAIKNKDKYKEKRKIVRDIFHKYEDDKSSFRVFKMIEEINQE